MARDANLIPMQVFSDFGGRVLSWNTDQIAALERALLWRNEYNIASVNMSLGGGRYYDYCDSEQAPRAAIIENLRSVGLPRSLRPAMTATAIPSGRRPAFPRQSPWAAARNRMMCRGSPISIPHSI